MPELILRPAEKNVLISHHITIKNKKLAEKVKFIILLTDGYTHKQIAKIFLLKERTIYRHKMVYKKSLNNLLQCKYKGMPI